MSMVDGRRSVVGRTLGVGSRTLGPTKSGSEVGTPVVGLIFGTLLLIAPGCGTSENHVEPDPVPVPVPVPVAMVNFDHLDHLGEQVGPDKTARIIHIYSEAPSYGWVGDDDEGIAAVDDAARAAVVYLRAFELTGDGAARSKAEGLIRFILGMQTDDGLFYNFVWNSDLDINTTHQNSRADDLEWWACRAVWALGVAARVLKMENPDLSSAAADAVHRTLPHVEKLLEKYPSTEIHGSRSVPIWLVHETASDATSELLLGLSSLERAYPDPALKDVIDKLAEGVARTQWGTMNQFPYAAHGSWVEGWHGWGNSQTQALSEIGKTASAINEARSFYSRLLVTGWLYSFTFDNPGVSREFEQIAYAVRCVSVGLIRLYEATENEDYLIMAGLAASWFTGNNVAGFEMYDAQTGRGHDGIGSPTTVNMNAGAESTIEALFTMLEVGRRPISSKWLFARGRDPVSETVDGKDYLHRLFVADYDSVVVVMNLTDQRLDILSSSELKNLLNP